MSSSGLTLGAPSASDGMLSGAHTIRMNADNMSEEKWADIPGYEGLYEVSNLGRVKALKRTVPHSLKGTISKPELIRSPTLTKKGYSQIWLSKNGKVKGFQVHNLVLLAFRGPRPGGKEETRHLNGVKSDNNLNNLAYGTREENQQDSRRHGTNVRPSMRGSKHPKAKLTEKDVMGIRSRTESGRTLAKEYGVDRSIIDGIRNGKGWGWLTVTASAAALLVCVSCTSNPIYNGLSGAAGGAASGCAIGAIVGGVPTAGIGALPGCAFGSWVGAASGGALGIGSTNPNNPPPGAWPAYPPQIASPYPPPPPAMAPYGPPGY